MANQKNIWDGSDMENTGGYLIFYLFCVFPLWLIYKILNKLYQVIKK